MAGRGHGTGPFESVEPIAGGSQNIMLLLRRDGRKYVFRRPPLKKRDNSDATMLREARVLTALSATGVPHPEVIDVCEDLDVTGSTFLLMEFVDGVKVPVAVPLLEGAFPAAAHRIGLSLVDAAAALSRVVPAEVGLEDFGRADGWLERQVPRWRKQLDSYAGFPGYQGPGELGSVETVAGWLERHRPTTFIPGVIHGDFHFGNVLVSRELPELAAVVDWELATIGDPLLDLAHLFTTWPDGREGEALSPTLPGLPTRAEMLERYAEESHRDLACFGWFRVLACYRLGILLEGSKARADAGLAPREVGAQLHRSAVSLFRRARELITEGVSP